MKTISSKFALLLTVSFLASCGGGNDNEAGAPTALHVTPTETTYKGLDVPAGNAPACPGAIPALSSTKVYISGGTAPYDILSTSTFVVPSTNQVLKRGDFFQFSYSQGCREIQILVRDSLKNEAIYTVRGEVGAVLP